MDRRYTQNGDDTRRSRSRERDYKKSRPYHNALSESSDRLTLMKKGLTADNTKYTLSITNNSGDDQNIALYQTLPSPGAIPVVWFSKQINNGNTVNFSWSVNWGLTWGTTDATLAPGVTFTSQGVVQPVTPFNTGINSIEIGYAGDFYLNPYKDTTLPAGQLSIYTSAEFTTDEAKYMQVAVTMNNTTAFVMRGRPKGTYNFITKPKYYVCITNEKQGTAISETYVSSPTEVAFDDATEANYTLDDHLNFTINNNEKLVNSFRRADDFSNEELTEIR